MAEPTQLDVTFQFIVQHFIETGRAPHYTELAAKLGVAPEAGKTALHNLLFPGFPGWAFPDTDYVSSFAPFSNLPTQYRITVDGHQKWFGQ